MGNQNNWVSIEIDAKYKIYNQCVISGSYTLHTNEDEFIAESHSLDDLLQYVWDNKE